MRRARFFQRTTKNEPVYEHVTPKTPATPCCCSNKDRRLKKAEKEAFRRRYFYDGQTCRSGTTWRAVLQLQHAAACRLFRPFRIISLSRVARICIWNRKCKSLDFIRFLCLFIGHKKRYPSVLCYLHLEFLAQQSRAIVISIVLLFSWYRYRGRSRRRFAYFWLDDRVHSSRGSSRCLRIVWWRMKWWHWEICGIWISGRNLHAVPTNCYRYRKTVVT